MTYPDKLRYHFQTEPYAHQRRALAKTYRLHGNMLAALPMRTGKTKYTIDWAGIGYHNMDVRRVLVVTPLSVMDVWKAEIELHSPVAHRITLLTGSTAHKMGQVKAVTADPFEGIDWLVVNYESVWRPYKSKRLDQVLAAWEPDLVVADECHKLKHPPSRQSRALARLGAVAKMRLGLTGTPVTKTPLDVYGQFKFIDPTVFPESWQDFKDYYGIWGGEHNVQLLGYRHLDRLVPKIRAHTFKVKIEDCFDLPPKLPDVILPVVLPRHARDVYEQMATEMIVEFESGATATSPIILTKALRLSQITSGFLPTEEGSVEMIHEAKLDAACALLADMAEKDEKAVVFCRFKWDYHQLEARTRKLGLHPLSLTGETPQAERGGIIKRFHADPAAKVFIAQTAAGSLGIDLTAARFNVWYSMDYSFATYAQAMERIGGPKQPRPTGNYYLVVPNSIDRVVLRTLKARDNLAKMILHSPRMLLEDDGE